MSRVFLSHSSRDSREAVAVKRWLIEQEPGLAEEIFLDLDPHTGIRPAERWKEALNKASTRCEAVICLLSKHWNRSHECAAGVTPRASTRRFCAPGWNRCPTPGSPRGGSAATLAVATCPANRYRAVYIEPATHSSCPNK